MRAKSGNGMKLSMENQSKTVLETHLKQVDSVLDLEMMGATWRFPDPQICIMTDEQDQLLVRNAKIPLCDAVYAIERLTAKLCQA